MESETEEKSICLYCGVKILRATALKTNGYCMPHQDRGKSYDEKIPGEKIIIREYSQSQLEKLLMGTEKQEKLSMFFNIMQMGDKIVSFKSKPDPSSPIVVELGFALIRNEKWITGFLFNISENVQFKQDFREEVSEDIMKTIFGENEWNQIIPKLQDGDKFIHFISSPFSWHCLCGRETYNVEREGEIIFQKLTCLN